MKRKREKDTNKIKINRKKRNDKTIKVVKFHGFLVPPDFVERINKN